MPGLIMRWRWRPGPWQGEGHPGDGGYLGHSGVVLREPLVVPGTALRRLIQALVRSTASAGEGRAILSLMVRVLADDLDFYAECLL